MRTPRVAYLAGDGIGPEVLAAARAVAEEAGLVVDWVEARIGWEAWTQDGEAIPEATWETLASTDACLFGAITSKPAVEAEAALPRHQRGTGRAYTSPILRIRRRLGLAVNVRPATFWPGVPAPVSLMGGVHPTKITVLRENTEDLYVGCDSYPLADAALMVQAFPAFAPFRDVPAADIAASLRVVTRAATTHLMETAFAHAEAHGHDHVTLAEKPNVLRATGGLVLDVARSVARLHPSVRLVEKNVDALCAELVRRPQDHPVIAATNLFGDILSDLTAGLAGGLGLAPSASYGPHYALFEPVHGSAPDIAGQGIADPIAAILSAAMLADHLDRPDVAERIERAVGSVLARREVVPYDLGGDAGTEAIAAAVVAALDAPRITR